MDRFVPKGQNEILGQFIEGPVIAADGNTYQDGLYMYADPSQSEPGQPLKMQLASKADFEAKYEKAKKQRVNKPRDPNAPKRGRKSKADKEAEAAAAQAQGGATAGATAGTENAPTNETQTPAAEGASASAQTETKKGGKKGA